MDTIRILDLELMSAGLQKTHIFMVWSRMAIVSARNTQKWRHLLLLHLVSLLVGPYRRSQ